MRKFFTTLSLGLLMTAPHATAGDTPVTVVELFTSQGCSSCPPANKFVKDLADDPDILALSYGVTYWDYLGWEDTFGLETATNRQKEYGKSLGLTNIYTPQIVLNGSAHSSRFSRSDVESMPLQAREARFEFETVEEGLKISIDFDGEARVNVVEYIPGKQLVNVKRGENRGRKLELANVVTDIRQFDVDDTIVLSGETVGDNRAVAVIIQDPVSGKILAARNYRS